MITSATARNTTDCAAEPQIAPFQTLKVVLLEENNPYGQF